MVSELGVVTWNARALLTLNPRKRSAKLAYLRKKPASTVSYCYKKYTVAWRRSNCSWQSTSDTGTFS